jgi:RNA polymerase sigma-70 factor, ECF subfamily
MADTPELPAQVTRFLSDWRNGDMTALDKLTPFIYAELRRLAASYMRRERSDHTLQPTALIHEAYLRLVAQSQPDWQSRSHFFGVAAQLMRQILVDHARSHSTAKRDGGRRVPLEESLAIGEGRSVELIALDAALQELAALDPRKSKMIELRFFAGLSIDETAEVVNVSAATVHRDLRLAETWLYQRLKIGTG